MKTKNRKTNTMPKASRIFPLPLWCRTGMYQVPRETGVGSEQRVGGRGICSYAIHRAFAIALALALALGIIASATAETVTYDYDPNGNVLIRQTPSQTDTSGYDSENRMTLDTSGD